MTFAIAILGLLIVANGVLAMSEMALAASRRSRLAQRAQAGEAGAEAALALFDEPNRFLSTVQIGISLVGVVSGAFGGQALAGPLSARLVSWGIAPGVADPLAFSLVVLVITFFALVVGELVPKRLALSAPERVSLAMAGMMTVLSKVSAPFVAILSGSTELILRPFGISAKRANDVSTEEITGLLHQSHRVGEIGRHEVDMIQNVFDISDRRVRSMITRRREVTWLDADAPWEQIRQSLIEARHSRLPVAHGGLDHVVGVVHVHEILDRLLQGESVDIVALAEPALEVPESLRATGLMERFRSSETRFAVVLDEYGGVEGIVTAGDVLQALLGELADVSSVSDRSVTRLGRDEFDLDGTLYIEELKDLLGVDALPREEERVYRTLGGLVTTLAGRIPEVGEVVSIPGWQLTVLALEGPRVDRIHVTRVR